MSKRKTGTREWAESNFNVGVGCSHNCLYCYARSNALRFKLVLDHDDWTNERLRSKIPNVTKKDGWVMFPTTHDITPFYLPTVLVELEKHMTVGNKVLIVTKPHMECVEAICEVFNNVKNNILFRFTIGTLNENAVKFWEPGAPSVDERMSCLKYAFDNGFATSVSMEPMLGNIVETISAFRMFSPWVTDKIWIGKMNKINNRVKKSSPSVEMECKLIEMEQSDKEILEMVKILKNNPKVEWKDSIKEVIEKYENYSK